VKRLNARTFYSADDPATRAMTVTESAYSEVRACGQAARQPCKIDVAHVGRVSLGEFRFDYMAVASPSMPGVVLMMSSRTSPCFARAGRVPNFE